MTLAVLWFTRESFAQNPNPGFAFCYGLLAFLAGVQILLLPINYGVLIVDKSLPRVAALGVRPSQTAMRRGWSGKARTA